MYQGDVNRVKAGRKPGSVHYPKKIVGDHLSGTDVTVSL